jgi:hypothetical protein
MSERDAQIEKIVALGKITKVMVDDITAASDDLSRDDNQYRRRVYVRAIFAHMEAVVYQYKQVLLLAPSLYSLGELAILREENYNLDPQGNVVTKNDKFVPLKQNYRFTVELFSRYGMPYFTLDCSGTGYQEFGKALQIRHDITHPKDSALIEISDDRLRTVTEAYAWFTKTNGELLDMLSDKLGFKK